jgi:glycogen synthase
MFGWEFPPNISGGLGTACYGIVRGLSSCNDVHVTFVVPKTFGNEESADVQLVSAENIRVGSATYIAGNPWAVSFLEVPSKLVPYLTPESFSGKYQLSSKQKEPSGVIRKGDKIHFSGKYRSYLFDEIGKYAFGRQVKLGTFCPSD